MKRRRAPVVRGPASMTASADSQRRAASNPQHIPRETRALTPSIAAPCTATAASASISPPGAPPHRDGAAATQSGIRAGANIHPAPCMVAVTKDHNANPSGPAAIGSKTRSVRGRSRERSRQAAAQAQPLAGFSP
jgi:hypothetical protein